MQRGIFVPRTNRRRRIIIIGQSHLKPVKKQSTFSINDFARDGAEGQHAPHGGLCYACRTAPGLKREGAGVDDIEPKKEPNDTVRPHQRNRDPIIRPFHGSMPSPPDLTIISGDSGRPTS
jgi:hypothetical protein